MPITFLYFAGYKAHTKIKMRRQHVLLIAILLTLCTLSSCSLFDKMDDISFDTELPLEFVIDEQDNNSNGKDYSTVKTLDATYDPEVIKYANKIKEFKINKITYSISAVTPNGVTFSNGKLIVSSSNRTIALANNISIASVSNVELTKDPGGFNELASMLLANKQADVKLDGRFNSTPIKFTVSCKFYVTVTANTL